MELRRTVLRVAWLMIGAAIGLAAGLLAISLVTVIGPPRGAATGLVTAGCMLPIVLLGLLPGAREVEVAAVRTMLGVDGELVTPERPRPGHRWRTTLLVCFHLIAGLLTAVLLVGLVPGAFVIINEAVQHRPGQLAALGLGEISVARGVLLGAAMIAVSLVGSWLLARLAARVAPALLGPTSADQLAVALARLEAESEHRRLARELHDGIGHALTIISVQAAAGRSAAASDPGRPATALEVIETTARSALGELDDMLGLLRQADADRAPAPELDRLPALAAAHRAAGMELTLESGAFADLPRLVSTTAYRIVAEALTNAERYAGPGPVRLRLDRTPGLLTVQATNPLPSPYRGRANGHGLRGMAERVALFGGTLQAGPTATDWVLRAEIPTGRVDG
jgi:signal transduction histidine kinase